MKVTHDTFSVEKSDHFKSKSISVKSTGIIFEFIFDKLYPNPLKIFIQEIMCNARDAHREAHITGEKPNCISKPIYIKLPTNIEPTIIIKDFGVGISPDRINDVYLLLGETTKNESDFFTGGHGVGSKTPLSYTDNFTIRTIFKNKRYTYLCFRSNSQEADLDLLSVEDTEDENSTAIEVTVKKDDITKAKEYHLF